MFVLSQSFKVTGRVQGRIPEYRFGLAQTDIIIDIIVARVWINTDIV